MASAMASMASRNLPPVYTIPVGPRVRPPRLLPGTKSSNTDPKPDEPPPRPGHVWTQGKWRNPASRAARDQRQVQSARAERALRHATHGMNIYAYSHIRTNQVVYSLTRVMQNTNILSQLLYYGKQTVPASLRRDLWRPYFSIHFPETPAGAHAGLKAYRQLRELANLRQLSPPRELLIATEADVQKAKDRYDPVELKDRMKNHTIKNLPVENKLLPQKLRAKKLMDQKASSVADVGYVLDIIHNAERSPAEDYMKILETRANKSEKLSARATRRLNRIREKEAAKNAEFEARKKTIQPAEGNLGLTPHIARRIALEHGVVVSAPRKGMEYTVGNVDRSERLVDETEAEQHKMSSIETQQEVSSGSDKLPSIKSAETAVEQEPQQAEDNSRKIRVLWADLRDATWVKEWTKNVVHGELDSRAVIKHERVIAGQKATIDKDGNELPGDLKKVVLQGQTTPHVFGMYNKDLWYERPSQMEEKRRSKRSLELDEWKNAKLEKSKEVFSSIDALYEQGSKKELQEIEQSHGWLFAKYQELSEWRSHQETYETLLKYRAEVEALQQDINLEDHERSMKTFKRLQNIEAELDSSIEGRVPPNLRNPDVQHGSTSSELKFASMQLSDDLLKTIEKKMEGLQDNTFRDTNICDLLQKRLAAEESNDIDQVAGFNVDLEDHEHRYIADLLGFKLAKEADQTPESLDVPELSEEDRDKGIEMPPPPKKSIFERIKSLIGR